MQREYSERIVQAEVRASPKAHPGVRMSWVCGRRGKASWQGGWGKAGKETKKQIHPVIRVFVPGNKSSDLL